MYVCMHAPVVACATCEITHPSAIIETSKLDMPDGDTSRQDNKGAAWHYTTIISLALEVTEVIGFIPMLLLAVPAH